MIQYAEVPVGCGAWEEGEVIAHDEETGNVTIKTDDGTLFKGCESLARFFLKDKPEQA